MRKGVLISVCPHESTITQPVGAAPRRQVSATAAGQTTSACKTSQLGLASGELKHLGADRTVRHNKHVQPTTS